MLRKRIHPAAVLSPLRPGDDASPLHSIFAERQTAAYLLQVVSRPWSALRSNEVADA